MNLTEEQVIELFEEFLDENYYVGELTEENVLWVYENKFYPMIDNVLYEENKKIREGKITSRTGPLDPRITKALKTARKKTPEVKDAVLTSKGNPKDFNTRQTLSATKRKGIIGGVEDFVKKRNPESPRFENGKSAGQGAPFHDYGKAADVAITSKNPRKSDYAAAKFASTAQSELIKQAKNKDDGPVIGFAVKPGEKSTPKSLSSRGYMKQPKGTPPGVQSIHIGYDNPGKRGTLHRDIRDKYAKRSNVYGPNRMVDPVSGTFALYQQQRTDAALPVRKTSKTPPLPVRKTPPLPVKKPKNEEVQFIEEEQVIELFEEFLDENYYVGELTEENVLWVYEEEFLPALEQQIEESAGCDCENCDCENCQCENVQEEQQISPKMQAYLNEMSKKGTKSIEHGGDGATTRRDVMIAILKAKKKKSGLSMKEEDLLAKLIDAEEKEDSGKEDSGKKK